MKWNLAMLNMRHWGQPEWLDRIPPSVLRTRLERIWPPMLANRNFFLGTQLRQNRNIQRMLFVDQPPTDFRRAMKTLVGGAIDHLSVHADGRSASYASVLPAISRSWWLHRVRHHIDRLQMNSHLLSWSYHPLFPEWFEQIPAAVKVFDAVDDWATHPQYQGRKEELDAAYRRIASTADVIFTVSDSLKRKRFFDHPHCVWVPNGVDLDSFRHPKPFPWPPLDSLRPPLIGYVGVIQNRLDTELLQRVVEKHPSKNFVFVGSVWPDAKIEKLRCASNVHLLGAVPYDVIPSILSRFQVALIPHRRNALTQSMNPLKIYEYLAAGLPIVSTAVEGTLLFANEIHIADSPDAFAAMIDQALQTDSTHARERRRRLVEDHTWERRLATMLGHIEVAAKKIKKIEG